MPAPARKKSKAVRATTPSKSARPPRSSAAAPPSPPQGPISQQQLETHLWGAADILRGKIDSSDYKHYIFGLLFFKRLCDVWQEEYEDRLARYHDKRLAADPDEHRFDIPKGASWTDVRKHSTDLGARLNGAFHAIEDANLKLKGVFQDVDFNHKERFPDATLDLLLRHFERYRLRKVDVDGDVLGRAYEYLIAQFADDAGKKGGEFYTPKQVARLIVECLEPRPGMSVYDPTAGSGGLLLEAVHFIERTKKSSKALRLFGQEMNLNTWAICQMNLFLHDLDDFDVRRGDTLRDPRLFVGGAGKTKALQTFDRVVANPPFSLKNWGVEAWEDGDPFGRDRYGTPPKSYGDLAFVQHMIASLAPAGKLGVVLPHGILFRGGAEGRIREGILKDDLVEAVIGLAPNLFYGTGIPACVLILSRKKDAARAGKVLFLDASAEFQEGKNQNTLLDSHVERIASAFRGFADEAGFARVVGRDEIETNDWNLNIARYVEKVTVEETIDVAAELRALKKLQKDRDRAEARMMEVLAELGYR